MTDLEVKARRAKVRVRDQFSPRRSEKIAGITTADLPVGYLEQSLLKGAIWVAARDWGQVAASWLLGDSCNGMWPEVLEHAGLLERIPFEFEDGPGGIIEGHWLLPRWDEVATALSGAAPNPVCVRSSGEAVVLRLAVAMATGTSTEDGPWTDLSDLDSGNFACVMREMTLLRGYPECAWLSAWVRCGAPSGLRAWTCARHSQQGGPSSARLFSIRFHL